MLRKDIEEYYRKNWTALAGEKTLEILTELTCKSYQLNQPKVPNFVKGNITLRPHNLGKIQFLVYRTDTQIKAKSVLVKNTFCVESEKEKSC